MKLVQPEVKLLSITPYPTHLIERAGRTCYKSESKMCADGGSAEAFVSKLLHDYKHESVIEHASATFWIKCDRGITHEIVRHRIASYSQESTRYVKYDGGMEVIAPLGLSDAQMEKFVSTMNTVEETYKSLRDDGILAQAARDVLPTCLKTEIVMTANFREWRHFLKLRGSKAAHPKIRQIAAMILAEFMNPDHGAVCIFKDLVVEL